MESPEYSGSFVPPLLISLAGIAASSIALLTYHLIVVRCCMGRRLGDADAGVSTTTTTTFHFTPTRGGGSHHLGVQGSVLKAIPIVSFSSGSVSEEDQCCNKECVICLGELEEGDKVRLLPNCGHLFHVPCIDGWFLDHSSCPTCRSPIIPPNGCDANLGEVGDVNYDQNPIGQDAGNPAGDQFLEQDHREINFGDPHHDENVNGSAWRTPGAGADDDRDDGLLSRHSVSLVLPLEEYWKPRNLVGLKRSLSLDHSLVVIDIPREISDQKGSCSCSCSCSLEAGIEIGSGSYGATKSTRQVDVMYSSRLLRPFSNLGVASQMQATTTNQNFPC